MSEEFDKNTVERFGKYVVEKPLGKGGFGEVYLATDPDVGQLVAIKQLIAEGDRALLKRFREEIRVTAGLRHKNIVIIHASGEQNGNPYLVMEYLEGQTLKQVIRDRKPLSILEKVRIMAQVAEGLAYAHSKHVVHRDVKPENIMLLPDGTIKIMDFGIALAPDRDTAMSQTMGIIGTPAYLSPEQIDGHRASEQTDIFSYGDVYYEILTGTHPFEKFKHDLGLLMLAIKTHEPPSVGLLVPGCPQDLEDLVHRALAKKLEQRYRSFDELRDDNEGIVADLERAEVAAIQREIPPLLEAGDLQAAVAKANQAYKLDPGNRELRRLREEINQRIRKAEVHDRVSELVSAAERQILERSYAEAVHSLDTAAAMDRTNYIVQERLSQAKALLDRSLQANRLVTEARLKQHKDQLQEAVELLQSALAIDPDHTEAGRLFARINEELKRRSVERQLQQAIRAASAHRAAHRFKEAIALLEEIEREQPGNREVAELRLAVEREQRADQSNRALAAIRKAMQDGDLDRVVQMVDFLAARFNDEPSVAAVLPGMRDWVNAQLRMRQVAEYRQQASDLLQQKMLREALAVLTEALAKFPDDSGLHRQYDAAKKLERSEALEGVLKQVAGLRAASKLEEALQTTLRWRRELGEEEPALLDLTNEIEIEIAQDRYAAGLDELLRSVRELMAARRYGDAVERIENAGEFRGEAELRALLETARMEAAILEEQNFAAQKLTAAVSFEAREQWEQALEVLEEALDRYPHNSEIRKAANRLQERIDGERNRRQIANHCGMIRLEIENRDWKRARALLRTARAEFPAESAFDDLAAQVDAGLFNEGLDETAARIRESVSRKALEEAEEILQKTRTIYGSHPRWRSIEKEVADLRETQTLEAIRIRETEELRRTGIAEATQNIRRRLAQNDVREGAAELESARAKYPDEQVWQTLEGEVRAVRRAAIDSIARNMRELLEQGLSDSEALARSFALERLWDGLRNASAQLSEARAIFPGERVWDDAQAEIAARQAHLEREIAQAVRACSSVPSLDAAAGHLEAVRSRYPDEPFWPVLKAEIAAAREPFEQASRIRESLARNDFEAAQTQLNTARQGRPAADLWTELQAEIDQCRTRLNQERTLEAVERSVRQQLERVGEIPRELDWTNPLELQWEAFQQADRALKDAQSKHGGEARLAKLQTEVDARKADWRRETESAVRDAIRQHPHQQVVHWFAPQIQTLRAKDAGEPLWARLEAEIRGLETLLNRESEIGAIESRIRERLQANDGAKAEAELAAGRKRYPAEGRWGVLEAEIGQWRMGAVESRVRGLLQANDGAQAQAELTAARAKFADKARWDSLNAEIAAWQGRQREVEIAAFEARVREFLRSGDGLRAEAELNSARAKYPQEARWKSLSTEIAAWQGRQREVEIAAFEARVRELLRSGDGLRAEAELNSARAKYPQETRWKSLSTEIAAWQENEIAAIESRVRQFLKVNDGVRAEAELNSARAKFPDEARWKSLNAEIAAQRREIEIAAIETRVRQLLQTNDGVRAQAEMNSARAKFPNEPRWKSLNAEIAASRENEIAAIEARLRQLLQANDGARAGAELTAARAKFPDEARWEPLNAEIAVWQVRRRENEIAAFEARIRQHLQANDEARAQAELNAALAKFPDEPRWKSLKAEITARQRHNEIAAIETRVRQLLEANNGAQAEAELNAARAKFPDEARWESLKAQIVSWQRENEIAGFEARIRQLLRANEGARAESELNAARAKYPDERRWKSLNAEIAAWQARQRENEIAAIEARVRQLLQANDDARAEAELGGARARFPNEPRWARLATEIESWRALAQQRMREVRDRDRDRMLAIAGQVETEPQKRTRKELDREAQNLAAAHTGDEEIASLAARIHAQVTAAPAVAPETARKPIPWKWAGVAAAVVIAAISITLWKSSPTPKPPPPAVAKIPVEIRTDPPGASVSVGELQCIAPCALSVLPGPYKVDAKLKDYEPRQETVTVSDGSRRIELALRPVPPPTLPAGVAQATLVVQAGVPGALVYVDNEPQSERTGAAGSVSLSVEAKAHDVRVEKTDYTKLAPMRVTLAPGANRTVVFALKPLPATLDVARALPDTIVSIEGSSQKVGSDGKLRRPLPVVPGSHSVRLTHEGYEPKDLPGMQFAPNQNVILTADQLKLVAIVRPPPPGGAGGVKGPSAGGGGKTETVTDPDAAVRQEWTKLENSEDPAALEDFERKRQGTTWAGRARERINSLDDRDWQAAVRAKSLQALETYSGKHRNGRHLNEIPNLQAELEYPSVDRRDPKALRAFANRYPNSTLKGDALKRADDLARAQQSVKAVLNAYQQAYNDHDLKRLKDVYPEVPDPRGGWSNVAAKLDIIQTSGDPQITGEDTAQIVATVTYSTKAGIAAKRDAGDVSARQISFRKQNDVWRIVSIKAAQ